MVSLFFILFLVATVVYSVISHKNKNTRKTVLMLLSIPTIFLLICVCILISKIATEHVYDDKLQMYESEIESLSNTKKYSIDNKDMNIVTKEAAKIYDKELEIQEQKIEISKVKWYLYFGK